MRGRGPSKEDEAKRLAKRRADMSSYEARTKDAQEKTIRKAAGVKEPVEIHAPKDVLDLTVMNLLADPALLDGHGSGEGVRTLTESQRRERQRAGMNERAALERKALDKFIKPEDDEPDFGYSLSNYEGEPLPEELDNLNDPWADDDDLDNVTLNDFNEGSDE